MYRNSHTASTKCQYQILASKLKWCQREYFSRVILISEMSRSVDPANTCPPWNPVARKKIDP